MVKSPYHQEQLTEGLLYQKYEPHIHGLTFTDMSKETVDAAYELLTTLDTEYTKSGEHLQYLYVLDDVPYTPYMLWKIKQSLALVESKLIHSSAVVADSFFTKVLEALVVPHINKDIMQVVEFFMTEAEAFTWLEKRRKEIGK